MGFIQSFIFKNGGTKVSINPNYFRIDSAEKTVFYKLENSEAEKKISFKDFDFIIIDKNTIEINKTAFANRNIYPIIAKER